MRKSLGELDYIPEAIGLLVGIGDGVVYNKLTQKHRNTYFRAGVAGLGLLGEKSMHWHPDVTIGMMTAAATLASTSIVRKAGGTASTSFPQVVAPAQLGGRLRDIPAEQTATQAGYLRADIPGRQQPTNAGYLGNKYNLASGKPATESATLAG